MSDPRSIAERVADHINRLEQEICEEWCRDEWPDCASIRHADGKALITELGHRPSRQP